MFYIAGDGSYGNAFNLMLIPHDALSSEQWQQIEEASDHERVSKAVEFLWETGTKVWMPDFDLAGVREVVL